MAQPWDSGRKHVPARGPRSAPEGHDHPEREGASLDEATRCDVFFITLKKSERLFSPTTRYNDYAISPLEFHWESQSLTQEALPPGRDNPPRRARQPGAAVCAGGEQARRGQRCRSCVWGSRIP